MADSRGDRLLASTFASPRIRHLLFAGALLTAFLLYTSHITSDLYGDERGHTYNVIATGDFCSNLRDPSMCHPPLYFMMAKLSYETTGRPWGMRIPSVIFALATVALVSFAAERILGNRFFLPAAWLAALSPFLLEFAAEGRAYAALIFFSLATVWAFFNFLQCENVKTMLLLATVSVCGALTHYFFWLELAALGIYYFSVRRRVSGYAWGVMAIIGIVLIPFGIILFLIQNAQFTKHLQVGWSQAYFSIPNFVARLPLAFSFGFCTFHLSNMDPARNFTLQMIRDNWILVSLVLISFAGLGYAFIQLALARTKWLWFLAAGIVIPVGIGLLMGKLGLYLIREKHLAVVWPCYFFLVLLAFDRLARTRIGWAIIGCYLAVVLVSIVHYVAYPNEYSRRMDWTGLNRAIDRELGSSDRVLFYSLDPQSLSLGKMSVLTKEVRAINLQRDKPDGISLARFARQIDESTNGSIFLINNETERHGVDPNSEVIRTLSASRRVTERRFGRNLVLYEFKWQQP